MTREERRERPLEEQRAELLARPTDAEIRAVYDRMHEDIRTELAERLGLEPWEQAPASVSRSGCGDFADGLGGESGSAGSWFHRRTVPDDRWPELARTVEQVALGYGFRPLEQVSDKPGNQHLTTTDQYGATVDIGNGRAAVVFGTYLGCHPLSR